MCTSPSIYNICGRCHRPRPAEAYVRGARRCWQKSICTTPEDKTSPQRDNAPFILLVEIEYVQFSVWACDSLGCASIYIYSCIEFNSQFSVLLQSSCAFRMYPSTTSMTYTTASCCKISLNTTFDKWNRNQERKRHLFSKDDLSNGRKHPK